MRGLIIYKDDHLFDTTSATSFEQVSKSLPKVVTC